MRARLRCRNSQCQLRLFIHSLDLDRASPPGPRALDPLGPLRDAFWILERFRTIKAYQTHRVRCCPPPVSARAPALEGATLHRLHARLIFCRTRLKRRKGMKDGCSMRFWDPRGGAGSARLAPGRTRCLVPCAAAALVDPQQWALTNKTMDYKGGGLRCKRVNGMLKRWRNAQQQGRGVPSTAHGRQGAWE